MNSWEPETIDQTEKQANKRMSNAEQRNKHLNTDWIDLSYAEQRNKHLNTDWTDLSYL